MSSRVLPKNDLIKVNMGSTSVPKWFLPTLIDVFLSLQAEQFTENCRESIKSHPQRLLQAGIMALETLLRETLEIFPFQPVMLSGPVPVLNDGSLASQFQSWTFSGDALNPSLWLLDVPTLTPDTAFCQTLPLNPIVPLLSDDPLTKEDFCVCVTPKFSLVMVAGETFHFSFDPEVVAQVWQVLRPRLLLTGSQESLNCLDKSFEESHIIEPHYKTVMRFTQLLLKNISSIQPTQSPRKNTLHLLPACPKNEVISQEYPAKKHLHKDIFDRLTGINEKPLKEVKPAPDVELLQAMFHEIRTPLTTIRILTRSLLKRPNLDAEVIQRLQSIDRECTEQIDRFNLIFKAVEIETSQTKKAPVNLTSTSLAEVLNCCIPRWQKQASRRNLSLEVILPQKMPSVVSDPTMLDQVLTGTIENFTSTQPTGAHIKVLVSLAGSQLKVQLQSQPAENQPNFPRTSPLKSLGQLLMFQPETGNLSLNLDVTKNLFQALGAKLIVRCKPQQGETLTIYFPIE